LGVETSIARCRRCHAVYQKPTLLPEGNPYAEVTPSEYFRSHDPAEKQKVGGRLARTAESIIGGTGRMLELGCGRGELSSGAARRGWLVAGVDMTPQFIAEASTLGVQVEEAPVEVCCSLDQTWDVVVLAAVLEHVYKPIELLRRVALALRPGGAVFIDVPNECSLYTRFGNLYLRLRGRNWALNLSPTFPPFHVVGFCPKSLSYALERSRLEIVTLESYAMTLPSLSNRPGPGRWPLQLAVEGVLQLGQVLGQGAGITCWARKPPSAD
jgi:SAM-dependent methyltransferase